MNEIKGVFEIAIKVRNLEQSEAFYCGVLGLESGLRQDERRWHFLWLPERSGMVVLQEDPGDWPAQHFAFAVRPDEMAAAVAGLRGRGVTVTDPITHDWMKASSAYFSDPDDNALEFCAPLH